LTTVGRFIIVFTELIVIGAFLSRFWLDRKNSDLSEELRQYRAILESSVEFEEDFRSLQTRIKQASAMINKQPELVWPLEIVASRVSEGIQLVSFSLTGEKEAPVASLSILVYSETSLADFIANLVTDKRVESVRVGLIKKEKLARGTTISLQVSFRENEKEGQ